MSRGGCSSILVMTFSSDSARCLSVRAYGKSCCDVVTGPFPLSWSSPCPADPPERERISRPSTSSCSPSLVTTSSSSHCSGRSRRSKFEVPGPPVRSFMASSARAWAKRVTECTHKRWSMMSVRVDFSGGVMECRFCARLCSGARDVSAEVVGECCGYERARGRGD